MDNENKNVQENHHKRNKHSRPKPYFIEPTGEKKDIQIKKSEENGENADNKQAAQKKNPEHRKPHHKHHHKQDKPKDSAPNSQTAQTSPTTVEAKPQNEKNVSNEGKNGNEGKNHNNRNRNKNKHKNTPKPDANAAQEQIAEEKKKATEDTADKSKPAQIRKDKKANNTLTIKPVKKEEPDFNVNDYEQIRFPSASEDITVSKADSDEPVNMVEVVGIRFKSTGKVYYFEPNGKTLKRGEYAIVETARGLEYGEVAMGNKQVRESDTVSPLRPVVRVASEADKKHHTENKQKEEDAFRICNEKIISHKLDMKLIDAQYTFDNSKLLFYFTSAGRVDFRELVKDLASVFKTRIELRQIGIRDEAKLMGGMGMCGRPLCCTLFLSDFGQVSIKMAKEQNLSLNSAKISGICGRLMCCLRYEHETYEYEIKRTPPVDAFVRTEDGNGTVTEINPLAGTVKVKLAASPDAPPKTYKREDVVMLQKKHNKEN